MMVRPIGIDFQEWVSNHPKPLRLRVAVVSVGAKAAGNTCAGRCQRDERKQTFR